MLTFSKIKEPVVFPLVEGVYAVVMPTGVLVMVLSISVMEPTSGLDVPPAFIAIPVPQLLMLRPT